MNDLTAEQKAAQDALQAAVVEHAKVFRPESDEMAMMAADWVLVVNLVGYDEDGDRVTAYHLGLSDGQMDDHRAIGLLAVGKDITWGIGYKHQGDN